MVCYMISRELLVQARYFHLVFWAFFGLAAAVAWWGGTRSSQPGVIVVIAGIMVYVALDGVYSTWRTMTEFEA